MIAKSPPIRSKLYLAYVREQRCCWCKSSPVKASHHVKPGHGSVSMKTCDLRALPLCHDCHSQYHRHGKLGSMSGETTRYWAEEQIVECLRGFLRTRLTDRGGW